VFLNRSTDLQATPSLRDAFIHDPTPVSPGAHHELLRTLGRLDLKLRERGLVGFEFSLTGWEFV
jgi:hypothetical protein